MLLFNLYYLDIEFQSLNNKNNNNNKTIKTIAFLLLFRKALHI